MSTNTSSIPAAPARLPHPSPRRILLKRAREHRGLVIGGAIVLAVVLIALFAPLIAPHDPYAQDLSKRLLPPVWSEKGSWEHIFGTDALGRDYLSRILFGARISLLIGISAAIGSGLIGTTLGLLAGYFGGRVDSVVTFIVSVRLALPVVLVSLAVVSLFGGDLWIVVTVLSLLLWDRFAVVVRSATQQLRNQEFVTAARAMGASTPRILIVELLPNLIGPLVVIGSLEVAHAILLESALSFLGLGVQPPTPSWGLMVSEGKGLVFFDARLIALPGAAIAILVLGINLIGDGLRDVLTPEGRS
ncbi:MULTISPECIES: ABC transporter permease [Stappia]|uniref:Peptide/nickel transport system permease protein n=1 Tax=Stappia indica TaxID=538381 RepID=A0A285TMJ7_9HYPH|nr:MULTISPECIES: ABC transporter permease [Stappia]MBC2859757.1 ABC transporter permease [Stappia sp. 28M-7]MCC4246964.1 ABC transporter permease [Stappia indica]SOC23677.1 peptide/nickel transport system permease protein [Stappia indica]